MAWIVGRYKESGRAGLVLQRPAALAEALSAKPIVASGSAPNGRTEPGELPSAGRPDPLEGLMVAFTPAAGERNAEAAEAPERRDTLERTRSTLARRATEAEYPLEIIDHAERLLVVAVERWSELIAIGRREHRILERPLRRPAEEAVVRHADCDVLIVH